MGLPITNDLVPSIGSITQVKSLLDFVWPNSSPTIWWLGNLLLIFDLINFSNALSEVVTGSYPFPLSLLDTLKVLFNLEC